MLKADLTAAGIPLLIDDESAPFHSLRHTYTALLAPSAPMKVTQELARHSTPVLTIGRYSYTSMKEKAEAVANLPLPGAATTAGPFVGLSRAELEAVAESLVVPLVAALVAHQVAPDLETGRVRSETEGGKQTP